MHYKTALYLCRRYKTILVGNLSTKGITRKGSNLSKINKDRAYALSFYTFRERLKSKGEQYGNNISVVDESYSSRMCIECKKINKSSRSETFKCKMVGCGFTLHRDIHGARNIMHKHHNPSIWKDKINR